MAGLAYLYQGKVVSFDDPSYIDSEFAASKLWMNIDTESHYHGLTSDSSASEYCPLVFNANGAKARIGKWQSRTKAATDSEYAETWAGTGYVSTTETYRKTNPAGIYYVGSIVSQTAATYSTTSYNNNMRGTAVRREWEYPVTTTCILSASPTTSSKSTDIYRNRTESNMSGARATYYTYTQTDLYTRSSTSSGSTWNYDAWRRSTKSYKSVKYGTNYNEQIAGTTQVTTTAKQYTYSSFKSTDMPEWYETLTITKEILHNYNV